LARRLRQKNKILLNTPDWSKGEIDELNGKLRRYVMLRLKKKEGIMERIKKLETPEVFGKAEVIT
jgi:hypothetical protein